MKQLMFCLLTAITLSLSAQSYDAALGIRLGTDWGMTAQLRLPIVHKNFVVEGIVQSSLQREEGLFTLLGKQHHPVLSRRLNLFMGGGVHAGWSDELKGDLPVKNPIGVTGVVGAEATIGKINLSYDFKPAINISGGSKTLYTQSAVSVRYVIAKRNSIYDKQKERQRRKDRKKRLRQKRRDERGKRWFEVWKKGN